MMLLGTTQSIFQRRWLAGSAMIYALAILGTLLPNAAVAAEQPLGRFVVGNYALRTLGPGDLPGFTSTLEARVDETPHDAHGVRLFRAADGRLYNHPVRQAAYGIANLNSYRVSGDEFYLRRAIAQADRLIETAVERDGAWFFPYPFDFDLHGRSEWLMRAPWYSGMAQGEALRLFVRLAQMTDDVTWSAAAHHAFKSLTLPRSEGKPWVSTIDGDGYLWFEEYAQDSGQNMTFNGHIFSIYGLFEYAQWSGDADAKKLTLGGLATVDKFAAQIRVPGGISLYCLSHRVPARNYHTIHITMLQQLYRFTGTASFAKYAESYTRDYPYRDTSGKVILNEGRHEVFRFGRDGTTQSRATLSLRAMSQAGASERVTIPSRQGVYYKFSEGSFAGWHVRESEAVRIVGEHDLLEFTPPLRVVFNPGRHVGTSFDARYRPEGEKTAKLSQASVAHISRRSWINGVERALVSSGIWQGYWVPASGLRN